LPAINKFIDKSFKGIIIETNSIAEGINANIFTLGKMQQKRL